MTFLHVMTLKRYAPDIIGLHPWSPVYRTLLAEGFIDSYRAAGHGNSVESSTFHGFQGRSYFGLEWGWRHLLAG